VRSSTIEAGCSCFIADGSSAVALLQSFLQQQQQQQPSTTSGCGGSTE